MCTPNEGLISVIIPVYQVERFLVRCIDSVINQTYKRWELILIDDGSVDNSGHICDLYAARDKRIIVIHQDNHGVSAARNKGLEYAHGEYIYFIDADDFVDRIAFEKLIYVARQTNADLIMHGYCKLEVDNSLKNCTNWTECTDTDKIREDILLERVPNVVWGKLFKNQLWGNTLFPVGEVFEDMYVLARVVFNARKMILITDTLYYYNNQNDKSVMVGEKYCDYARARYGKFLAWKEHANIAKLYNHLGKEACIQKALHAGIRAYLLNIGWGYLSDSEFLEVEIYLKENRNYLKSRTDAIIADLIINNHYNFVFALGAISRKIVSYQQKRRKQRKLQSVNRNQK